VFTALLLSSPVQRAAFTFLTTRGIGAPSRLLYAIQERHCSKIFLKLLDSTENLDLVRVCRTWLASLLKQSGISPNTERKQKKQRQETVSDDAAVNVVDFDTLVRHPMAGPILQRLAGSQDALLGGSHNDDGTPLQGDERFDVEPNAVGDVASMLTNKRGNMFLRRVLGLVRTNLERSQGQQQSITTATRWLDLFLTQGDSSFGDVVELAFDAHANFTLQEVIKLIPFVRPLSSSDESLP